MSDHAANERVGRSLAGSEASDSPIREASHGLSGPHYGSPAPRVLARVPDLESTETDPADTMPRTRGDGRLLSSGPSMKVLAAAGALLLLLALGLPLLFSDRDRADTTATDEVSAWEAERPASSASEAPAWGGLAEGASNRQSPLGGSAPGQTAGPRPLPWGGAVPAQAWDAQSNATPWTGGPESQPPLNPTFEQPAPPAWDGQVSQPGTGAPPKGLGWNGHPSPAPGVYPESDNSWPEPARRPTWQTHAYGESTHAQAKTASPVDTSSLPSAILNGDAFSPAAVSGRGVDAAVPRTPSAAGPAHDASRPAGSGYEAYSPLDSHHEPQTTTNRSVRIGEAPPAAAFQYGTNGQWNTEPAYRTADARAGYPQVGSSPGGYSSPYSSSGNRPSTNTPAAVDTPRYPTNDYRSPAFADRMTDTAPRMHSGYPAPSTPASGYGGMYPEAGASSAGGRDAGTSSAGGRNAGTSLTPRYGERMYPSSSEPGVARFQGGIEKPTGTDTYDRNRSGIY